MAGRGSIHLRVCSLAVATAAAALACPLAPGPASAGTVARSTGDEHDCHEPMAFVNVPAASVRRRVPPSFKLYEPAPGQAMLFVRGARCAGWNVGGKDVPTVMAQVGAVIESPDGDGCMTHGEHDYGFGQLEGDAAQLCSYYSFFVATDNRRYVKWLRAGGLGRFPVYYTRKIRFRLTPAQRPGEFTFDVRAGGATPWPFRLRGTGQEREGALPMTVTVWNTVGRKTIKFTADPDVLLGHAAGTITTPPGTGLAKMLGGPSMRFAGPYSLNHILRGKLTKEVRSR